MQTEQTLSSIIDAYQEALSDVDAFDIIEDIEKRLEAGGNEWIIAGKRTLLKYHKDALEAMKIGQPLFGDHEGHHLAMQYSRDAIFEIMLEIQMLSGRRGKSDVSDPALKQIKDLVSYNFTIDDADLHTMEFAEIIGHEIRQTGAFAVALKAHEDQEIILTARELRAMLSIIENSKPSIL